MLDDHLLYQQQPSHAGVGPEGSSVMLPDLSRRLSHMEESVSLLMSGAPLPADLQRADTCTKVTTLLAAYAAAQSICEVASVATLIATLLFWQCSCL